MNQEGYRIRQDILDHYKQIYPNIENYVNTEGRYKYKFEDQFNKCIGADKREAYNKLSKSLIDIRNFNAPTSVTSNAINQTDNEVSNEIKKNVKKLLSKGYSFTEIIIEMQNIYGAGTTVSYHSKHQDHSKVQIVAMMTFKYGFLLSLFLVGKGVKSRLYK